MNKVLFINNFDSFVYIIVDYFLQNNCKTIVVKNSISLDEVRDINPDKIVISPGPGHPATDTGNVIPIIKEFGREYIPILGVCLGLQAIVEAFGGKVERASVGPVHGMVSMINHDEQSIYKDIINPFPATRYHSLAAKVIPKSLIVSSTAEDGTIMGVRHIKYNIEGVQFHPESIMTKPHGMKLIQNFIKT
ncbi:MAG: aminodeoxychorismate/anthranilate synthase component II [Candidatus Lokiarchaeota archaeon]|nr:aminodeoxychorismate/anthranilate synthase component II [Candidatus Lokiarchaeota archaeon]